MRKFLKSELGGLTGWTVIVLGLGIAAGASFAPGSDRGSTLDGLGDGLGPVVETRVLTG